MNIQKIKKLDLKMDIDFNGKEFTQYSQDRYCLKLMIDHCEDIEKENEKLKRQNYFMAGYISVQEGFTDKTLDQIFEWVEKEIGK